MNVKHTISLALALAFVLGGCARFTGAGEKPTDAQPEVEMTKIRLPMGYIPSVQFTPFYVAADREYYQNAGLDVEFDYRFETDGIALVAAGELPFALVSAEQLPLARAQGLPVVYVMSWWRDFPVAVVALSSSGIAEPSDLKGKKIGLPGLFGASYVGLRALLKDAGLAESDVRLESIGFNQVEALVSGQVDAAVVYANNEPVQLRANGHDIVEFPVAEYATLPSNGIITNEKTLAENPDLVRRFVQATIFGLRDTLETPSDAFDTAKKFVEGIERTDESVQLKVLLASIEFWKSSQLGHSSPEAWDSMQQLLLEMGLLKEPIDLNQAFTNEIVDEIDY